MKEKKISDQGEWCGINASWNRGEGGGLCTPKLVQQEQEQEQEEKKKLLLKSILVLKFTRISRFRKLNNYLFAIVAFITTP